MNIQVNVGWRIRRSPARDTVINRAVIASGTALSLASILWSGVYMLQSASVYVRKIISDSSVFSRLWQRDWEKVEANSFNSVFLKRASQYTKLSMANLHLREFELQCPLSSRRATQRVDVESLACEAPSYYKSTT